MRRLVSTEIEACPAFSAACDRLITHYDVQDWWPAQSRFEVMVGAILVQNTRWANAAQAIEHLKAQQLLVPAALLQVPQVTLQDIIRPAGCQSIKARRLLALADWLVAAGGSKVLDDWPTEKLRAALLSVHGIGDETADAMLAFAFARPVFVADQYARHWLSRTGWIDADEVRHYRRCRAWAERQLFGADVSYQDLHAAIVMHAQSVCGRVPDCRACLLQADCRSGQKLSAVQQVS